MLMLLLLHTERLLVSPFFFQSGPLLCTDRDTMHTPADAQSKMHNSNQVRMPNRPCGRCYTHLDTIHILPASCLRTSAACSMIIVAHGSAVQGACG